MTITIQDENFSGAVLNELELFFQSESVSVKEIIEQRVLQEVARYNEKATEVYRGLVKPSAMETVLNGFKAKSKVIIDGEKQVYVALDAFQKNGFFVLIDDKQVDSLDMQVQLSPVSKISFIKLVPLVGG